MLTTTTTTSTTSTTTETPMLSVQALKLEAINKFTQTISELLDGLELVFPECPNVKDTQEYFKFIVKPTETGRKLLIEKWHKSMSPFYAACQHKDINALLKSNLEIITKLDIQTKWNDPTFDADSRDALWVFIDELNEHAQNYQRHCVFDYLSPGTSSKIQEVSTKIAMDLSEGRVKWEDMDIMSMSKNLVDGMSEEDLSQFLKNLPQIFQTVQSFPETSQIQQNPVMMMNILASMPGFGEGTGTGPGLPPGFAEMLGSVGAGSTGMSGMPSMGSLSFLFGGSGSGGGSS